MNRSEIDNTFTEHSPNLAQVAKYERIREKAKELAEVLLDEVPSCPDLTAAVRKLRECVMTANAAIAINS